MASAYVRIFKLEVLVMDVAPPFSFSPITQGFAQVIPPNRKEGNHLPSAPQLL